MKYAARVIAGPELAAGFRLAGLPVVEALSPFEGVQAIQALARAGDVGLLLVEEPILAELSDLDRQSLLRRPIPIIVPVPRPSWAESAQADAYILELLRRAIGYRVRLQ